MKRNSWPRPWLALGAALIVLFGTLSANAAERAPAVLLCARGPQYVDFAYLKSLFQKEGFQVDYTGSIRQADVPLTWEKATNYNCIVMMAPEYGGNNRPGMHTSQQTAEVLDRFLEAGGGVLLVPDMIHWDIATIFKNWGPAFGERFGAWFLRRQVMREKDDAKATVAGYFNVRYHYTENVARHPVTEGVRALWYPAYQQGQTVFDLQRGIFTSPIRPTPEWTILLRGSDTAYTTVDNVCFKDINLPVMDSTETYASAPPIAAAREYKKGRMVFFTMNAEFHFTAGMHHNKGGNMDALRGGYTLEAGLKGKPSDLGRLIANSIRWVSEPSLRSGAVGGYVQEMAKLCEPDPGKSGVFVPYPWPDPGRTWRGLIGARTALSDGYGTAADYAKAAKEAGLDYVVFLETFEKMTPRKMDQMKADCRAASDGALLLIPGLYVQDNRDHHQYYFGANLVWPGSEYLTPDGKRFDTHARENKSGLPHIEFMVNDVNCKNTLGYFNFPSSPKIRMWNVKLYDSVGLFHYRDGKLADGMDQNFHDYLEVNNAGCNIFPMSINLLNSPDALKAAVARGDMLTCAKAGKIEQVPQALMYSYLRNPTVFVSSGPDIVDWSCLNRDYTGHAENYITANYRFPARLRLRSDAGLKEIEVWDGLTPYMRIALNGEKEYERVFQFNHNKQKNLILEVRDVNDRLAVSAENFDRNHMNMHYWCSDRINGALKHGPIYFFGSFGEDGINFVSKGQDSFNLYACPMPAAARPFVSSAGKFGIERLANRPLQAMVSEDGGVFLNSCCMYFPETEKLWSVWGTLGPLVETELFDYHQTYVAFRNHFGRPNPYIPTLAGIPNRGDIVPGLNITEYIFKKDMTLETVPLVGYGYGKYGNIEGNEMILTLCRDTASAPVTGVFPGGPATFARWKSTAGQTNQPFRIERGGFFAISGSKPGSATVVQYNVGNTPFSVDVSSRLVQISAAVEGRQVRKGDILEIKTLGITGEVPDQTGAWRYLKIADYLGLDGKPGYAMRITRGKALPVTDGFCNVEAAGGGVEFSMPNPKAGLQLVLPVRVFGLNDRWSAYCLDKVANRARPIGVRQGVGYARFDPEYADLTQAVVGHPVVADNPDLTILFTQLGDERYPAEKGKPYAYYLAVNNPTDKPAKAKLKKAMDLPGFDFAEQAIDLPPGALLVVREK